MYDVTIDEAFVLERVHHDDVAERRMKRLVAAMHPRSTREISEGDLAMLVSERGWTAGHERRTGACRGNVAPAMIFNTFARDAKEERRLASMYPALKHAMLLGQGAFTQRAAINHADWCACQAAVEMHSIYGCLHACDYCHVEGFINMMVDIEHLVEQLPRVFKQNPAQNLYKYDNLTDQICFEPEYGASELLVPFFGRQEDKYLLLYTKSDNVDHLLNLDHRGKTIINWSLSGATQARLIEKGTPGPARRIEAMRKCQEAGYTVRCRFSPIVPVEGWQEETASVIDELFSRATPDVITMDVLGFMDPGQVPDVIDASLLDQEALGHLKPQETKAALARDQPRGKHFFPHEYRSKLYDHVFKEVRKHDDAVPVALCNETFLMWEDWEAKLGMQPDDYACCCGPTSVPGNKWLHHRA